MSEPEEYWVLVDIEKVSISDHVDRQFARGNAHIELGNDYHTCWDGCIYDILGVKERKPEDE